MNRRKIPKDHHDLAKLRGFAWLGPAVTNNNTKTGWKCSQGHEWLAPYKSINRGSGCPYCSGNSVGADNNLAIRYPAIAAEWHPTKNGELTPDQVMPGSTKKVWWQCRKSHEWQVSPNARTNRQSGCPYCSGRSSSKDYNLALLYPEIAQRWHKTKNASLTPGSITPGSARKVWWQCSKYGDHVWQATVASVVAGNGCPFCAGKQVDSRNSFASRFPDIATESHPSKNGELTAHDITAGSKRKVWWECRKNPNHEWQATVHNRTSRKSGCPFCRNKSGVAKKASSEYNFAVLRPELMSEWDFDKNALLRPEEVTPGSNRLAWWLCPAGHSYRSRIKQRLRGQGCAICAGKQVIFENSLESTHPELIPEWNYKRNGDLLPSQILAGSNKRVWWVCPMGHEWQAAPNGRTRQDSGCPKCSWQTSRLEIGIYAELQYLFPDAEWRTRINGTEVDTYIPTYLVAVEVDGYLWHARRLGKDKEKAARLRGARIRVLRIRDSRLEGTFRHETRFVDGEPRLKTVQCFLKNLVRCIPLNTQDRVKVNRYLNATKLQNPRKYRRMISYLPGPPPEESLLERFPDIAAQWHPEKNDPLRPEMFRPFSQKHVWWECANGHEWYATIASRTSRNSTCPKCPRKVISARSLAVEAPEIAAEWFFQKNAPLTPEDVWKTDQRKVWWRCSVNPQHAWEARIVNRTNKGSGCPYCKKGQAMVIESGKRKLKVDNARSLSSRFPKIAKEWHYEKNLPLTPDDVTYGSNKKVWWLCTNGHEWQTQVAKRTTGGRGCPFCKGAKVCDENSLAKIKPSLASEWHPTKNAPLTPNDVTSGSGKKVWWRCCRGHEWETTVSSRATSNRGCPYCAGRYSSKEYNLAVMYPDVAKEWHRSKNGPLSPEDVTPGSHRKVWWQCSRVPDHIWQATVANRTGRKSGCPMCRRGRSRRQ